MILIRVWLRVKLCVTVRASANRVLRGYDKFMIRIGVSGKATDELTWIKGSG